jgi:hypothetical protein
VHCLKLRTLAFSLVMCASAASAATLTQDPLTQLPLPAMTVGMLGNAPTEMPPAAVCKSQYRGNYYDLMNSTLQNAVAWYIGNLKGFRHIESADHSTHVFSDTQRSLIVIGAFRKNAAGDRQEVGGLQLSPVLSPMKWCARGRLRPRASLQLIQQYCSGT